MKRKLLLVFAGMFAANTVNGQVGINTDSPHTKSVLEIVSKNNNTGVLFPRLTTTQINAIAPANGDNIVDGLWVYNTDSKCYNYWAAAPQNQWLEVCGTPIGVLPFSINCSGSSLTGTLTAGTAASGVTLTVPYTNGTGAAYTAQTITSTGVTGLTATIAAGNFANGAGNLVFTITGTPSSTGTASFAINMGGSSCTGTVTVGGGLATLNCAGSSLSGTLLAGTAASGVTLTVPYTAGNGGAYSAQSISSTGVTGLTATIAAGNFANGAGNLVFTITGTPSSSGTANFAINMGGSSCTANATVSGGLATLNCAGATSSGVLTVNTAASGVTITVPYTGGNGGAYSAQTITSTGVTGLTATIAAGNFANGAGNLVFTISGTPTSAGDANFAINMGGSSCSVAIKVLLDVAKLKILSVGSSPYMLNTGSTSGMYQAMTSSSNFGPTGTVPTKDMNWDLTVRGSSSGLSDVLTGGYKLVVVGYAYSLSSTEAANLVTFINNGGTVFFFTENPGSGNDQTVWKSFAGASSTYSSWGALGNTNSSSLLNGVFGDARNSIYGNESAIGYGTKGYDASAITVLATDSTDSANAVIWKANSKNFYYFGDGGMTRYTSPMADNYPGYPWLLDANKKPAKGTWHGVANEANSVIVMNLFAQALVAAQ